MRRFIYLKKNLNYIYFTCKIVCAYLFLLYIYINFNTFKNHDIVLIVNDSIVLFYFFYFLCILLALPSILFNIILGVLFGFIKGGLISLLIIVLSSISAFLISRYYILISLDINNSNKKILQITKYISKNQMIPLILIRMNPLLPTGLFNYLFGLTSISLQKFIFITILGVTPITFFICYVSEKTYQNINLNFFLDGLRNSILLYGSLISIISVLIILVLIKLKK